MGKKEYIKKIIIRAIKVSDSIADLTTLLNRSYRQHAKDGLLFLASHQDAGITRQRISDGLCIIAEDDNEIIGTITYSYPSHIKEYLRVDCQPIASIAQLAVDPSYQRKGIGERLIRYAEFHALSDGAKELALDTAEAATNLIAWYHSLGYRIVSHFDSVLTNYRSVIMSKDLRAAYNQQRSNGNKNRRHTNDNIKIATKKGRDCDSF